MSDHAIHDQIKMAGELSSIIDDFMEDLDGSINALDLLDFLAQAGLVLAPTPVSPVRPTITLASEAYFACLGVI
jgi:hypothetical protein